MSTEVDLVQLILDRKGDRSYERLSKDCGGIPTRARLGQIATTEFKTFPDPATLRGLSRGLGVPMTDVVLAAARSLGLRVRAGDEGSLVVGDAGRLPVAAQQSILNVARQMLELHDAGSGAQVRRLRPAPSVDSAGKRAARKAPGLRRGQEVEQEQQPDI